MAKPSRESEDYDSTSDESEVEFRANEEEEEEVVDEEELEAVARSADDSDDDADSDDVVQEDDDNDDDGTSANEVAKREKARLKEMQRLKKQKIQEILDAQNASIDADMNKKGSGRLNYLLQQTELFAHFAKGNQPVSQKKAKGRGRHASKMTEQEEDEECLKEEENGLSGASHTRLVTQPS